MPTYRIVNWDSTFENNRTRELKRLDWVPIPNRMDGVKFMRLMNHPEGVAHFGIWILLVELASKGRPEQRGTFDLEIDELSLLTRVPEPFIKRAIERLKSPSINWIEEIPQDDAGTSPQGSQDDAALPPRPNEGIPQGGAMLPPQEYAGTSQEGAAWVRERRASHARPRASVPFSSLPEVLENPRAKLEAMPSPRGKAVSAAQRELWNRFGEFIAGWARVPNEDRAMQSWISCVATSEDCELAFEARARYLNSDEVSRGVVMDPARWLFEQKNAGWRGRWPQRKEAAARATRPEPAELTEAETLESLEWLASNDQDPAVRADAKRRLEGMARAAKKKA